MVKVDRDLQFHLGRRFAKDVRYRRDKDQLVFTLNDPHLLPGASQGPVIATLSLTAVAEVPKGEDDSFQANDSLNYQIVRNANGISLQLK
jgi:hypothetical protein